MIKMHDLQQTQNPVQICIKAHILERGEMCVNDWVNDLK